MTAAAVKPSVPEADVDFVAPIEAENWADRSCARCGMTACVTVGTVSWTSTQYGHETAEWIEVGRACVAPAVAEAEDRRDVPEPVIVTLPTWSSPLVAELAGITYRQLHHWTVRGYLTHEREAHQQGSGYERLYLADQIERARVMGQLVRVGWLPAGAAELLNAEGGWEIAQSVVSAITVHRQRVADAQAAELQENVSWP